MIRLEPCYCGYEKCHIMAKIVLRFIAHYYGLQLHFTKQSYILRLYYSFNRRRSQNACVLTSFIIENLILTINDGVYAFQGQALFLFNFKGGIYEKAKSINNSKVLNSQIPGVVFGLLVMYLGIRYYFSVGRLKEEVYKSTSEFCWIHIMKEKKK